MNRNYQSTGAAQVGTVRMWVKKDLAELVFVIWAWYSVNLVPCNTVVPKVFLHTHVWQIRVLFVNNFLCVVGANLLQSLPAIIDEIVSVWMILPSLAGCDAVINGIVVVATDGAFQIILSIQPIDVFVHDILDWWCEVE